LLILAVFSLRHHRVAVPVNPIEAL
jgi:hypothetical protein